MQDRTPQYPGRVQVTPENGAPYFATLELADEPLVEGTPLNKENLLQDATAALMGLTSAATPDDMLKALANGKEGKLTFDQQPTQNSANPVTSGGVYTALNGLITYGTAEMTPGTSPLATGTIYVCYE